MRIKTVAAGAGGIALGVVATLFYAGQPRPLTAASNDRYGDYVMATGAVSINPRVQTDGVWMLDYRSGKLLGTVIDKSLGKIVGWAEVDLADQFEVKPLQDVHFMMTTGYITQGQSALYVAETTTGRFGVYTMGPGANGAGITIRRHDMTSFRQVAPGGPVPGPLPAGNNPAVPLMIDPKLPPAPSVPRTGEDWKSSSARKWICRPATYATWVPCGEIATMCRPVAEKVVSGPSGMENRTTRGGSLVGRAASQAPSPISTGRGSDDGASARSPVPGVSVSATMQ